MESLLNLLGSFIENETTLRFVVITAAALTVAGLGLGVSILISSAIDPIKRRIGQNDDVEVANDHKTSERIARIVDPLSKYILPNREQERFKMGRMLIQAGFRSPKALQVFYGLKALLALGLPIVLIIVVRWFPTLSSKMVIFFIMLAAFVGVVLPNVVLTRLLENRLKKLRNGFADALDMLVVCVESGLGLSPAIERVSQEIRVSHPELAEELALVNAEVRAGQERVTALKNLSERTGLPDIRGLVSLLVQTLKFGTSVADTLRVYSEEFRDKRMQAAEERAALISTKLIFPLVLCLFPGFFVVAIGPAVLRLIEVFRQL